MRTWGLGYEKSKERAKKVYSRIGRIKCPALDDEMVVFNSAGFNHLVRKGRIPRPRNEQKRRFVLLEYAEQIIKNPRADIEFRQSEIKYTVDRYGEEVLMTSVAKFWTFAQTIDGCVIKVVIRQIEDKQKIFFSIMGDDVAIDNREKNKKPPNK